MRTDITEGVIISAIFVLLLALYFTYKRENKYLMKLLVYLYRPQPAKLPKDTKKQDWFLFILMLFMVVMFGIKLITLMVVISDSMVPEFQRGDIFIAQSIVTKPEVGDIITFTVKERNTNISHRVVRIEGDRIITKGDNNPQIDNYGTITQKNIIAKAILYDGHPIVLKKVGALFITDYSRTGVIYKWGDRYQFMVNLSATIKAWGFILSALAIVAYLILMAGERKK